MAKKQISVQKRPDDQKVVAIGRQLAALGKQLISTSQTHEQLTEAANAVCGLCFPLIALLVARRRSKERRR